MASGQRRVVGLATVGLVLAGLGLFWLSRTESTSPGAGAASCAKVLCPRGRLCDPRSGECVAPCKLPGMECESGRICDEASGECLTDADGGRGDDGGLEDAYPASDPDAEQRPSGPTRPGAGSGTTGAAAAGPLGVAPRALPPPPERGPDPEGVCAGTLCGPGQRCSEGACQAWACGAECRGPSRCVEEEGQAPRCEPADCDEDRFQATNAAPEGARELLGGVYDLAFCAAATDWFSLSLRPGQSVVADLAFNLADVDLDLELLRIQGGQPVPAVAAVGQGPDARITYVAPQDSEGSYLLRVYEVLAPGSNIVPMRYRLRLRILDHAACTQDWECGEDGICDRDAFACVERDCRRNVECKPDEACDPRTGECEPAECEPDLFEGMNRSPGEAPTLELGRLYPAMTRCEGEPEWFRIELPSAGCLHGHLGFHMPPGNYSYDLDLGLYGPGGEGELIFMSMKRGEDDEDLWRALERGGTYFLQVSQGVRNTYDLKVDFARGPCRIPCQHPQDCMHYGMMCDTQKRRCVGPGGP